MRAVAIVPVVLFHTGLSAFDGGFVGVDVFFVISGYLITSIIIVELDEHRFSVVSFYERRARRILPALFVTMGVSALLAYSWMLPDELENFGQSLVATSVFSNNLLLALTTGYWDLASQFKPLLHTWSLGIEEQYYLLFPLFLMLGWRYFKSRLFLIIIITAIISLVVAQWEVASRPEIAFYLLPSRAWELLAGSCMAFYAHRNPHWSPNLTLARWMSALGLSLVLVAVTYFSSKTPTPSICTLLPIAGTVLIVLFAKEGTQVNALLSSRLFVGIGLISYSAYLWHFAVLALARVYFAEPPSLLTSVAIILLTFLLACLSWRFVELPFRKKGTFGRRSIFALSATLSTAFVALGLYLHETHGVPTRIYSAGIVSADDMYIGYNERVQRFSKNAFVKSGLHVLVIGDSFARDFVNMTIENFEMKDAEIVYRSDFDQCLEALTTPTAQSLLSSAEVVVLVAGKRNHLSLPIDRLCMPANVRIAQEKHKKLFYVGPKDFGYNLNWLVRLDDNERKNQFNPLPMETLEAEKNMRTTIPKAMYISLLAPIVRGNLVPVTDEAGRLISPDRAHLTRQGAMYLGKRALKNSAFGQLLDASK